MRDCLFDFRKNHLMKIHSNLERFSYAGREIVRFQLPRAEILTDLILTELNDSLPESTHSHLINGRWENTYLSIEKVPAVREVIIAARNIAVEVYGNPLLALFDPVGGSSRPPFWFNLAEPREITGVHDHVHQACISGVFYLRVPPKSGNLFFREEGKEDFVLESIMGKIVLFPSSLRHGVMENRSEGIRISLAFNIFSLPIPAFA